MSPMFAAQVMTDEQLATFGGMGGFICVCLFLLCIEVFPAIVAVLRGHQNSLAIFMVCLFFGWTCFGWIIALIWACTDNTRANNYHRYR